MNSHINQDQLVATLYQFENLLRKHLQNSDDVHDVILDLFVEIMNGVAKPRNLHTYVYTAIRFKIVGIIKARIHDRKLGFVDIDIFRDVFRDPRTPETLFLGTRAERQLEKRNYAQRQKMYAAMSTLKPIQRQILCIEYVEGYSRPETIKMLELTATQYRLSKSRAIVEIRRQVKL